MTKLMTDGFKLRRGQPCGIAERFTDAIAHWLSLNAGDFSRIDDFCARLGDQFYPWEREESEALYLNGQGEE